jgi:hypothetical protein
MLNGPFIGGGHGVWRPILVCPPHYILVERDPYESNQPYKKKGLIPHFKKKDLPPECACDNRYCVSLLEFYTSSSFPPLNP